MLRIGIDLGGTKMEVIALGSGGDALLRERKATPQGNYPATIAAVAGLVAMAERKVMFLRGCAKDGTQADATGATVGIGIPGAESRASGLVKNANSTCLIGKPLKRDLELALGRA